MNIEMIPDTTDDTCAVYRQGIPNFLAHEKTAFTLGALLFPSIADHLLECDRCIRTADALWRTWHTPSHL